MRLTEIQRVKILDAIRRVFGEAVSVLLFGSRVDEQKRGGDIDLLVTNVNNDNAEENLRKTIRATTKIRIAIGDQKIDLITTPNAHTDQRLVVREALAHGIPL